MIKLFKNVFLMPYTMFIQSDLNKYECAFIQSQQDTDQGFTQTPTLSYTDYLRDNFDGSEKQFFDFLSTYRDDSVFCIYASREYLTRIFARFLVELYPDATMEDLEKLYMATMDKLQQILVDRMITITPDIRRTMLLQASPKEEIDAAFEAVLSDPLFIATDQFRKNLAFEWLYFDYLLNGMNSSSILELCDASRNFIFPHFIMFHDVVVSMNNLMGSTSLPLKLTYPLSHIDNTNPLHLSETDSAEMDADLFVKRHGEDMNAAIKDE